MKGKILRYLIKQEKPISYKHLHYFIQNNLDSYLYSLLEHGNAKKIGDRWVGISSKKLAPTPHEKILLNAVCNGSKPSAEVSPRCLDLIKELNLNYRHYTRRNFIVVSKNKKIIEEIVNYFSEIDKIHSKIGLALGFPKTAVESFDGKTERKKDLFNVPKKYQGFFAFSEDHYNDEIKVIEKWIE